MIIAIRERLFKNRNAFTYIVFAVLGLAFLMPSFVRKVSLYGDWISRVNGQEVSYHDYLRKTSFFEQQITYVRQQYGQYADMFLRSMGLSSDPKELALKAALDDELLNQATRKLDMHFDDAYVAEQLDTMQFVQQVMPDLIPMYVYDPSGQINEERLSAYLKRTRLSASGFDYKVREAFGRVMLLRLLAGGIEVPSFELLERFIKDTQGRKYSIITLSFDRIVQQEKTQAISDTDLQDFYVRNKDEYRIPEKRGGITWSFTPEAYKTEVSDTDIEVYYDTHKAERYIETPAHVEVRHILFTGEQAADNAAIVLQELRNDPSQFAVKAKEFSADKESASKGGLLKSFAKGTREDKAFERAAFLLQADGDISDVVKTDTGFEILQRVGKTQIVFKPLEKVKKEIRNLLAKQHFAQDFAHDLQVVLQSADHTALKTFVHDKGGNAKDHAPVQSGSDKLSQALFSLEKQGDFSFYIDGDKGVVVQLTSIAPRSLPDLASIKDDVISDLYEVRAKEHMRALLQEARQASAQSSFQEVAQRVHGTLETTDFISPVEAGGKRGPKKKHVLPMEAMLALEKAGLIVTHETERDGYLIRCDEVAPLDMEQFLSKKEELSKELERERLNTGASGFVASLYRDATIETNRQSADE